MITMFGILSAIEHIALELLDILACRSHVNGHGLFAATDLLATVCGGLWHCAGGLFP